MNEARRSRPNILLIVVDDMGFSDAEPFGGEIACPNLTALAARGLRLRNFHVSSLCAPTRAMLLTGVDNHLNGLGTMPPMHAVNQYLQPGYEGALNHRAATLAELLREAGYFTCLSGKWHLGANPGFRPEHRGFERVFSLLGGGASHFDDARALSATEVPHTRYDEDGIDVTDALPADFYSTTAYTERMLDFLSTPDGRPFFAYLAYTAPHDPLHVPDDWLERHAGAYDAGYDVIRRRRLERMIDLGLVPPDLRDHPGSGLFRPWDELDADERRHEARRMQLYASMITCVDEGIGRVLALLEQQGRLDDTLVLFLSDNGANPKQPSFYPPNTPAQIEHEYDNSLANLGRKGSFASIGGAWAEVANTPFSYFKTTTYEGGTQVPLIVAGPGVERRGIETEQVLHVTDVLPSVLDFVGVQRPEQHGGQPLAPVYGRSWKPWLAGGTSAPIRGPFDALAFEMLECRAVIKGDRKLLLAAPPYGNGQWRLHHLREDPRELHDLAALYPGKTAELLADWDAYATAVGYIRAEGPAQIERMTPDEFFRFGADGPPGQSHGAG